MFGIRKPQNLVTDKKMVKELVEKGQQYLQKSYDFPTTITRLNIRNRRRPVEMLDIFDTHYADVFELLADTDPMNPLPCDHDYTQVMNAQLQKHSYILQGDLTLQIHLAPVVLRGKTGIMMHQVDWDRRIRKDGVIMTGFLSAKFLAFEEDGSKELGLQHLWDLVENIYESDDEDFNLDELDLTTT